jgi:hypothetical protein
MPAEGESYGFYLLSVRNVLVIGLKKKEYEHRDCGYFQISRVPSFHEAGVLCWWKSNASLVAYISALVTQEILTVGDLTEQYPTIFWGFVCVCVNTGNFFMRSNSSYIHNHEKGRERGLSMQLETTCNWRGSPETDPFVEWCLVKLRSKEAVVIPIASFLFSAPHEVFQFIPDE